MGTDPGTSEASTRDRLLDSARVLFSEQGPDGVSIRELAAASGCNHALVARRFGSKKGLERAVVERLASDVRSFVAQGWTLATNPFGPLFTIARDHPVDVRLLVRCGLGDLPAAPMLSGHDVAHRLIAAVELERGRRRAAPTLRARVCAYASMSVLLGWITFEGFLVAGSRLRPVAETRRDAAMAAAAWRIALLAADEMPVLSARRRSVRSLPPAPAAAPARGRDAARAALLDAAVALFASRGPAAVTTRQIAESAGVNLGLIHRHFGSKAVLVAEAIEAGSAPLLPAALSDQGFDLDSVVAQARHTSLAPRLIARTLVDGIDIAFIRDRYPVQNQLLTAYPTRPRGAGPGDLTDPRLAVAAATGLVLGSTIWDRSLRAATGLDDAIDLDPAVTTLARLLLDTPRHDAPAVRPPGRRPST